MKKYLQPAVFLLSLIILFACVAKKQNDKATSQNNNEEWKGMDEFHMMMAETFHPYKDSSNLQPVKNHATDLASAATTWANEPIPDKVNNNQTKAKLIKLQSDALALSQLVKTGSDQEISGALAKLHDQFHELQEAWYAGSESKHEHH